MTDDKLLEALGQAAREARSAEPDAAWDALAAGELSDEERAALLSADEGGELAELFSPLGGDFEAGVLADVLGIAPGDDGGDAAGSARARRDGGGPAPTPANRPFWMLWAAPLVAVAAALLLFFALPAGGPDLPDYAWEVSGGDRVVRGSDIVVEGPLSLAPGSAVEVSARPGDLVDAGVAATAFVRRADGRLVPSGLPAEVAASGAVRWTGRSGEGALTAGVTEVVLVVHPAGADPAEVAAAAVDGRWPTKSVPVVVGTDR